MKELEIKNDYPPISAGFKLEDMKDFNIIIGKNNAGKTRFFEAVKKEYDKTCEVVYIKANDVVPSDNQLKTSADSSDLIKNLSKLFSNLNIDLTLKKQDAVDTLKSVKQKTNKNLCEFSSSGKIRLHISDEESNRLKIEWVIRSLIGDFKISEDGVEDPLDPKNIGQGYQRLLIASVLKTYVDMVEEIGTKDSEKIKEVLFLFEEPELYLHPALKRELNSELRKISEIPHYTVIISTHDPYFLWSNMGNEKIQTYSFEKTDNKTKSKSGDDISFEIEDEILHISLFNRMMCELKKKGEKELGLGKVGMEKTSETMSSYLDDRNLKDIRKYQFEGEEENEYSVLLPIYIRNILHHQDINQIDEKDIKKSIEIMTAILSKL